MKVYYRYEKKKGRHSNANLRIRRTIRKIAIRLTISFCNFKL